MVVMADGTENALARSKRMLTTDPGMGVARHADAGYEQALEVSGERGIRLPSQRIAQRRLRHAGSRGASSQRTEWADDPRDRLGGRGMAIEEIEEQIRNAEDRSSTEWMKRPENIRWVLLPVQFGHRTPIVELQGIGAERVCEGYLGSAGPHGSSQADPVALNDGFRQ
jgi:hypothetical protein